MVKKIIIAMTLFLLVGCSASSDNKSDKEKEMTVKELKEAYGTSTPYNTYTTSVKLNEVTIGEDTLFSFNFVTDKNVSHLFEFGFYDHQYDAIFSISLDDDVELYRSELTSIDADQGNGTFGWSVAGSEASDLFSTSDIIYIRLEVYDNDQELFTQYSFVGAANTFID